MILGAGETSEKTGAQQIYVSNRSFERAQALATITGGRAIHFEDWEQEFPDLVPNGINQRKNASNLAGGLRVWSTRKGLHSGSSSR
jgi:shikimate 5-dehydrogenase